MNILINSMEILIVTRSRKISFHKRLVMPLLSWKSQTRLSYRAQKRNRLRMRFVSSSACFRGRDRATKYLNPTLSIASLSRFLANPSQAFSRSRLRLRSVLFGSATSSPHGSIIFLSQPAATLLGRFSLSWCFRASSPSEISLLYRVYNIVSLCFNQLCVPIRYISFSF